MNKYSTPDKYIQQVQYDGESYRPLVDFESWRVAVLNYGKYDDELTFPTVSAHTLTDEIFVLMEGNALLFTASEDLSEIYVEDLQPNRVYNVRKNILHHHILSKGARILIVENANTGKHNSRFVELSDEQQQQIRQMVKDTWNK